MLVILQLQCWMIVINIYHKNIFSWHDCLFAKHMNTNDMKPSSIGYVSQERGGKDIKFHINNCILTVVVAMKHFLSTAS